MHDPIFARNWQHYKPQIGQRWPALTPSEIEKIDGDFEELAWLIQLNYGLSKPAADMEIRGWMQSLDRRAMSGGEFRQAGE